MWAQGSAFRCPAVRLPTKKTAGAGGGLWVRSGEEFGRCVLVFYVFRLVICKQRAIKKDSGAAQ